MAVDALKLIWENIIIFKGQFAFILYFCFSVEFLNKICKHLHACNMSVYIYLMIFNANI